MDLFESIASALIDGPSAWQTPQQIADAIGVDIEVATDALADLDVEGLIDVWAEHEPLVVTLTALAAERLGVALSQVGRTEIYCWSRECVSARSRRWPTPRQMRAMEEHDRALRGVAQVDGKRHAELRRSSGPPEPTVLLTGTPLVPWDEVNREAVRRHCERCAEGRRRRRRRPACATCGEARRRMQFAECPTCLDKLLSGSTYCLRCGRWGWEEQRKGRKCPTMTNKVKIARRQSGSSPAAYVSQQRTTGIGSIADATRRVPSLSSRHK